MQTTHTIWGALDGDGPMKGIKRDFGRECILFEVSQDTDDGTYPRLCDYMRDVNALDREGASHFLNRLTRKKNKTKIDCDGVTIIRDAKWEDIAILKFKEPLEIVMGKIGDRALIEKVKAIRGRFHHEFFWTRNGRQDKVANGYEIWFEIDSYLE